MPDMSEIIYGLKCLSGCTILCRNCAYSKNGQGRYGCRQDCANDAIELLKEQEPKPPIHIHDEYPEHDWERDEDGEIDEFAMNYEFHNGPMCKRCGYSFCEHCKPNGWNEEPCVIDYYQCPKCGKHIFKNSKNIEYCVNCGQAVKWNGR